MTGSDILEETRVAEETELQDTAAFGTYWFTLVCESWSIPRTRRARVGLLSASAMGARNFSYLLAAES